MDQEQNISNPGEEIMERSRTADEERQEKVERLKEDYAKLYDEIEKFKSFISETHPDFVAKMVKDMMQFESSEAKSIQKNIETDPDVLEAVSKIIIAEIKYKRERDGIE